MSRIRTFPPPTVGSSCRRFAAVSWSEGEVRRTDQCPGPLDALDPLAPTRMVLAKHSAHD
ncbi:hypothetical protein Micbo1qcDRAFT_162110, partial [Microdochium bolleyi]